MPIETAFNWNVDGGFRTLSGSLGKAGVLPVFYTTTPRFMISLKDQDGDIWGGLNDTDTIACCIDTDFAHDDDPPARLDPADAVVYGSLGLIQMDMDLNTDEFLAAVSGETGGKIRGGMDVQVFPTGEAQPSLVFDVPVELRNVRDPAGAVPSGVAANHYTKTEADALLDDKLDKVGTEDAEITVSTKGIILKAPDGTRIRIRATKTGAVLSLVYEEVV